MGKSADTGSQPRVLMLYLEPAPYVVGLVEQVRALWPGRVDALFAAPQLTQPWPYRPGEFDLLLPPGLGGALSQLRQRIAFGGYAIIHLAGWGHRLLLAAMALATACRTPIAVESDTQMVPGQPRWKQVTKLGAYRLLFRLPAIFLPAGTRQAAHLRHYGVECGRIKIARMTVDVAGIAAYAAAFGKEARIAARRRWGIAADAAAVLYVGRLESYKGIHDLLTAYRRLRREREGMALLFAGSGSLEAEVRAAAEADRSIRCLGHLLAEELWSAYCVADLLVLPSRFEAWGLVVNEAMAAGLPVVATDGVGCVGDLVVDGETGFVVPPGDSQALSMTMQRLIEDCGLRRRLGENAGRRVAPWTLRSSAELTVSAWYQALA